MSKPNEEALKSAMMICGVCGQEHPKARIRFKLADRDFLEVGELCHILGIWFVPLQDGFAPVPVEDVTLAGVEPDATTE